MMIFHDFYVLGCMELLMTITTLSIKNHQLVLLGQSLEVLL